MYLEHGVTRDTASLQALASSSTALGVAEILVGNTPVLPRHTYQVALRWPTGAQVLFLDTDRDRGRALADTLAGTGLAERRLPDPDDL